MRLAEHFQTTWVPEFAREYISALNTRYTLDDVLHIAFKQKENEKLIAANAKKILFIDTEMIMNKVWLKDVFDYSDNKIEEAIVADFYDLYLLTTPDIKFVADPVRENPHRREELFETYRKELNHYGVRFAIIGGEGETRFGNSLSVIGKYFRE